MPRRSKRSESLRRYWRSVKAGRRYRRSYSERHFSKVVVRRLKARKLPAKKPRKARKVAVRPIARFVWVPEPDYRERIDEQYDLHEWLPQPSVEFGVREVLPAFVYGGVSVRSIQRKFDRAYRGRRYPAGKPRRGQVKAPARWVRGPITGRFLPSRALMVYVVLEGYARGESSLYVVGYRIIEPDLPWKAYTLAGWWRFLTSYVWDQVRAYVEERNQRERTGWGIVGDKPVLWHFVKEN